jgi:hypothetical protein
MREDITRGINTSSQHRLVEAENGFRKGGSYTDYIVITNPVIGKQWELNLPTLIAFLDYGKDFQK